MRTPEFQFLDKLEEMKRQLAREQSQLWLAFLPVNCKENILSLKETPNFMQIVQATLNLVRQLIKKANAGEQFSSDEKEKAEEFNTLFGSIVKGCPQKEDSEDSEDNEGILESAGEMFRDLLGYYRSHLERFCAKYHLAMPEDKTHVLMGIIDSLTALIEDTGEGVSLFQLQEMEYTLNLMATPIEALTQSHSVRALPYLRHIHIEDSVVAEIERAHNELFTCLNAAIVVTQNELQNIIADSRFSEFKVIEKLKSELVDEIGRIRASFDQSPFDDLGLYDFVRAMKEEDIVNFGVASPAMFQQPRRETGTPDDAKMSPRH